MSEISIKILLAARSSLLVLLSAACIHVKGQSSSTIATVSSEDTLVQGKLANGFQYFLLRNLRPPKTIETMFISKVGIPDENDNELQYAHLIEHLAFRGSIHFPNGFDVYMRSHGLERSRDFSGNTGNVTTYNFTTSSQDSSLFHNLLLHLSDLASGGLLLSSQYVDQERAAVLNEAGMAANKAFQSMLEATYLVFDRHQEYTPSTTQHIENARKADVQSLQTFYNKWYRPEYQGIVIVGDIDLAKTQNELESLFGKISSTTGSPETFDRKKYDVTLDGQNKVIFTSNGLLNRDVQVDVLIKRKTSFNRQSSTDSRNRSIVIDRLCNAMFSERIQTVRSKDSILNSLTVGIQRNLYAPLAGIDALTTSFQVSESDDIVKGLQIALVELRKISLWGFTNEELDLAKHLTVQNFKDQYMNPTSSTLKRELMEVYLTGGAFRKDIFSFLSSLTNEITLNEINALIDEWAAQENNTNVVVSLENQALLDVPTITGEIIRTVKEVRMRPVPRYISTHKELAAVPNVTVSYSVLSSTESDVVRIKLDNGIKVLFKKLTNGTTDDHDLREIYIHGFDETPQNVNLGPPSVTRDVILQAYNFLGVDGLNYSELQEWKRQKNRVGNLDGVPYIKENEHGIKGEASFNNYQALLLLIYHYFTTAHIDTLEVEKWIARATEKSKNPYKIVDDSIKAIISPQNIPSKEFKVNNAQIKSILEMYNQIISNSGNLTFVIAGSFSFDEIIKSTVNYLGSIPRAPNRKSNPKRASTIRPAKQGKPQDIGNTRLTLVEDSVGNVSVRMVFGASSGGNELDQLKLQILNEALRSRLMQRLRVEEQAVYDVYSRLKPRNEAGYYAIDVSFQTQPKDVARSTHFVVDEISKLTEVNMDVQTFRNSVAYIRSRIQMQRDSPDYWINSLIAKEKHNRAATDGEAFLDGLTPSDLKLAAAEMISVKKYAFFEIL